MCTDPILGVFLSLLSNLSRTIATSSGNTGSPTVSLISNGCLRVLQGAVGPVVVRRQAHRLSSREKRVQLFSIRLNSRSHPKPSSVKSFLVHKDFRGTRTAYAIWTPRVWLWSPRIGDSGKVGGVQFSLVERFLRLRPSAMRVYV